MPQVAPLPRTDVIVELRDGPELAPHRIRRSGGGRKRLTEKHPQLLPTLKKLVESTTLGDPESPLLWTARSQRNLVRALEAEGYRVSQHSLAKLLAELGYSLQGNRKKLEGAQHPDRNAQFEHINETVRRQLEADEPAISVDTKKKELVGSYKNGGRELRPQGDPELVLVHDFPDEEIGKAVPYGVYDLAENEAWVSVGISHDTAEFAVDTIRTWYRELGQTLYPQPKASWWSPMRAAVMAIDSGCGKSNSSNWPMNSSSRFPFAICRLEPANGTRLSIVSFPSSPKTGGANP